MRTNPWLQFTWPIKSGQPIKHYTAEDLRRWIALATILINAHEEGAEFGPIEEGKVKRYAQNWSEWMRPYTEAIGHDFTTAEVERPNADYKPGAAAVWYEDNFTADISGTTDAADAYGEFIIPNCTLINNPVGIYNVNRRGYPTPQSETSFYKEYDDFRPGTPFLLSDCSDSRLNGFYRVRTRRMDGSTLYLSVCTADNQPAELAIAECTGTLTCNFGGDWYTLRGSNGHCSETYMTDSGRMDTYFAGLEDAVFGYSTNQRWWTEKDSYHRYPLSQNNGRGPNDGRPPSGGQFSADFNGDWIRTVNPNLYHTYDQNSHRWIIDSDFNLFPAKQYTCLIPAYQFLPAQCDPKEQIPPYYFKSSYRRHWKYNAKVAFQANQITEPDKLGAIQSVRGLAYNSLETWYGSSSDRQYGTTHLSDNGKKVVNGFLPPVSGQNQKPNRVNYKYSAALQNMIELACEEYQWCWPADNTYKTNWLKLHAAEYMSTSLEYQLKGTTSGEGSTSTYTYGAGFSEYGLAAFNPKYDAAQPAYPPMNDECWGENGSAFELILKLLGSDYYDWYYDDQYPYLPKRILDIKAVNKAQNPKDKEYINECLPMPHGVWRRTWKYSLGYVRQNKMRSSTEGDPTCENYTGIMPYSETPVVMFGHIRMTAPSGTQYAGEDLEANHGPDYTINDAAVYNQRIYKILNHSYKVLSKLVYRKLEDIEVYGAWNRPTLCPNGYYDTPYELLDEFIDLYNTYWNDDVSSWSGLSSGRWSTIGVYFNIYYSYSTKKYSRSATCYYAETALVVDNPFYCSSDAITLLIRVTLMRDSEEWHYSLTKVGIPGNLIDPPEKGKTEYLFVPVKFENDKVEYLRFRSICDWDNWHFECYFPTEELPCAEFYETNSIVHFSWNLNQIEFAAVYDWSKYPDAIWTRTIEKADYKLIDWYGYDENPPVIENDWITAPTLYDANFPVGHSIEDYFAGQNWPYDNPNYEPLWKIKAESVLMEDLEDNGVYYILDFNDSALDTEQTSRKFDILLTVTGSSSEPGSKEAAFDALSILTSGITAALNTRDNYNARGLGRPNNYNTPTASEKLIIDAPMFPVNARLTPSGVGGLSNPVYLEIHDGENTYNYGLFAVLKAAAIVAGWNETSVHYELGVRTDIGEDEIGWTIPGDPFELCEDEAVLAKLPYVWKDEKHEIYWVSLDDYPEFWDYQLWRVRYRTSPGYYRGVWSVTVSPNTYVIYL